MVEGYKFLSESSLNRIVSGHETSGYAMISASRNENSTEENNRRYSDMKHAVKDLGYSWVAVYGGYQENQEGGGTVDVLEKSLIVYPYRASEVYDADAVDFNKFKDDMLNLGDSNNQDTVLIKEPNHFPAYYDCSTGDMVMEFKSNPSFNNLVKIYFTALKKFDKHVGSPKRFSFNEEFDDFDIYSDIPPKTYNGAVTRTCDGERAFNLMSIC